MAETRNISKTLKDYKKARADRIKRRAQMYIDGEFSLDEFYALERLDAVDDRLQIDVKETAAELMDLNEQAKAQQAASGAAQKPQQKAAPSADVNPAELDNMTAEEFKALPLYIQSKYYQADQAKVREILERRPAYMDIIDPRPKPRSYKGTTIEEFGKMTLADLQALYNEDPALFERLQAESRNKGGR